MQVVGVALGLIVLVSVVVGINAWIIMLLWGALGLAFGFFTIGYGQALLVSLAMTFVSSFFRTNVKVNRSN